LASTDTVFNSIGAAIGKFKIQAASTSVRFPAAYIFIKDGIKRSADHWLVIKVVTFPQNAYSN